MQTRPNIPQRVYDLAIARDLEGLRELQNQGHCLRQFHFQFDPAFNAVTKLALDGHGNAAEFLVDHLIGSINDLVLGYACAGNMERVLYWVSRGGDVHFAAAGFGYFGNIRIINTFLNYCIDLNLDFKSKYFHHLAIFGLARGLHHALLDQYLNLHFPENLIENDISNTRQAAIERAIQGYARRQHKRGLELAAAHGIDVDQNYYAQLSVDAQIESIPKDKLIHFMKTAALYGFDEPLLNYVGEATEHEKKEVTQGYYLGGHQPIQGALLLKNWRIINALFDNDHFPMIESYLNEPETERNRVTQNIYTINDYFQDSPNGRTSALLSKNQEKQTRQLLQIKDEAKREHLLWLATGHSPDRTPENTPKSLKLKRINHIFRKSPLGFDCAMALGSNQNRLIETLHLILFSLRGQDHLFSDHNVLPLIIAHLLNTTEANATKIHGHFAGVFAKHLKKDTIPASEAPTLTRKGSH